MKIYRLEKRQRLALSKKAAWEFFSKPENLAVLTPPEMKLRFIDQDKSDTYAGKLIRFRVSPFPGIQSTWVSQIAQLQAPSYFIDIQLSGPYALWYHEHRFNEIDSGVEIVDLIHYALPLGPLGRLLLRPIVKPKLEKLFEYRKNKLNELFNN